MRRILCLTIMHVESHIFQPPMGVLSLVYGILSVQKNVVVTCADEMCVSLSVLSFSYKLDVGKHVTDILNALLLMLMKLM